MRSFLIVRTGMATAVVLFLASWLSPPVSAQTYWFETYERAVSYIDNGRVDEAHELLAPLTAENPIPKASVKIPGNQVLHFLPYFQRARIQVRQGDYSSATHSLEVSEAFGAILRTPHGKAHLSELRAQIVDLQSTPDASRDDTENGSAVASRAAE
jgi:hypothetical protein